MARLIIKSAGFENQVIELKLGTNRFGRGPENDFPVEHASLSPRHCELRLADRGLKVTDCGSASGTFVDDKRIEEALLHTGQTLRLGEVEFFVETSEVAIAIPKFDLPRPSPPVILSDGSLICPRHPRARATYQCTHCLEVLCDACVHRVRRRGGKVLNLCPLCSHGCEPRGERKRGKKSLLERLQQRIRSPLGRPRKDPPS